MHRISKYLLTVSLFFSIFSFSGYAENSYSSSASNPQTELFFVNKQKASHRIVSYKKVSADWISAQFFSSFIDQKQCVINFNRLIKVKFDSVLKRSNLFEIANCFLQIKTIPPTSDEDIFTALFG